jgi:adenylosuccinate synthase
MAYSLKYPDAPRAKVLGMGYEDLADAMEPVRDRLKAEASELLHMDSSEHCDVFRLREFDALIDEMMWLKRYGVDIITHAQATELIATSDTVFEGAQGILIDENHGFHPYTTWSDCTLKNAEELAKEAGAEVIQRTGIIRTYMTRHGPGPMAGELFGDGVAMPFLGVADFTEQHNSHNPWQLDWRVGMPDFVAWRYALLCNFASTGHSVDSLAITHADKLEGAKTWACITEGYEIEAQNAKPTLEAREEATKRMMGPMGNHPWPNYINQEKLVGHGFVAETQDR